MEWEETFVGVVNAAAQCKALKAMAMESFMILVDWSEANTTWAWGMSFWDKKQ